MSQKSQVHKRIVLFFMKEVLEAYDKGQVSLQEGIKMLDLSRAHFFRYLSKYRKNPSGFGISYIRDSKNRKLSDKNNREIEKVLTEEKAMIIDPDVRIGKFNFPAVAEQLKREKKIEVSPETLRKRAIDLKLHKPKTRYAKIYREVEMTKIGRLFQHDASLHQWSPYMKRFYLILTVDDHSRMIVCARFFAEETSMNHILCLKETVMKHGLPLAYYTDRHSIFTFNKNKGPHKRTYQIEVEDAEVQWKKVMEKLQIQHILAKSPQAKGKVESKFKYLQARVVRRCTKEQVTLLSHAQRIIDEEVQYYNEHKEHEVTGQTPKERWEFAEKEGRSVLRPFTLSEDQSPKDIFCLEYKKRLDKYGKTKIKGTEIQLKKSPSKTVIIRYIADGNKKEMRVYVENALLKVIKA